MGRLKDYNYDMQTYSKGGNAKVHVLLDCPDKVIKILNDKKDKEKKARFHDELKTMFELLKGVEGVMPVSDFDYNDCFYVMPKAIPLMTKLHGASFDTKIDCCLNLCRKLAIFHSKDISHRDIKPDNLYYHDDDYVFGDFGLVDYPDKSSVTPNDRGLGATFTMAPEMRRDPKGQDGKKADVYSMAKTIWMIFTGNNKGFAGRYDYNDPLCALRYHDDVKNEHMVELEYILRWATDSSPESRPAIEEVIEAMENWKKVRDDEYLSQISEWNFLKNLIFNNDRYLPNITRWDNLDDILYVLNNIVSLPVMNYMFFPDHGGLDLELVEKSSEEGCIVINANGLTYVVKPKWLRFDHFKDPRWDYFMLELDYLDPIFDIQRNYKSECLVEDYPGHYVSAEWESYGVYDYDTGEKFPEGWRSVERYVEGRFLVCMKTGPYNSIRSADDGRHNDMSPDEFRDYIEDLSGKLDKGLPLPELSPVVRIDPLVIFENTSDDKIILKDSVGFMTKLDFSNTLLGSASEVGAKLEYKFQVSANESLIDRIKGYQMMLMQDGTYKKCNIRDKEVRLFAVRGIKKAIELCRRLNAQIESELESRNLKSFKGLGVDVIMTRVAPPSHLFSFEEVKELMRNLDDRQNNKIVVDEDGNVGAVQDISLDAFYPVSYSAFGARKNYVGKYSSLSYAEDVYENLLMDWETHLESGSKVFSGNNPPCEDANALRTYIQKTFYNQ